MLKSVGGVSLSGSGQAVGVLGDPLMGAFQGPSESQCHTPVPLLPVCSICCVPGGFFPAHLLPMMTSSWFLPVMEASEAH